MVAALTNEASTARIQDWLSRHDPESLCISDWVIAEFASALSIKVRMGQLGLDDRARVASAFTRLRTESLTVVSITRDHFQTAARFAEQATIGLRAGDALHVAVAADRGATICTLDRRLAEAATALAVSAMLV